MDHTTQRQFPPASTRVSLNQSDVQNGLLLATSVSGQTLQDDGEGLKSIHWINKSQAEVRPGSTYATGVGKQTNKKTIVLHAACDPDDVA